MSPTGAPERLRVVLAVVLAGPVAFVATSVLSTTTSPSIVLIAAAAATALATVVATSRLVVTGGSGPRPVPLRTADGAAVLRAARVTDTPRHPLRPRAPGLG